MTFHNPDDYRIRYKQLVMELEFDNSNPDELAAKWSDSKPRKIIVLLNQIPKLWYKPIDPLEKLIADKKKYQWQEIYERSLRKLDKTNQPDKQFYDLRSALGSFEVSYKGRLIWSKRARGRWPNVQEVAQRCIKMINAIDCE